MVKVIILHIYQVFLKIPIMCFIMSSGFFFFTFRSCTKIMGNDSCAENKTLQLNCDVFANTSTLEGDYLSMLAAHVQIRYLVLGFYMATFVFGFIGNTLVIYIVAHFESERIKSVANYYIWNLAFADLLFVLSLPLFCWSTFVGHWPFSGVFGDISCKLAYTCRDITKFASAWTLVALSIDRCLASFHNKKTLRTIKLGKIVIAGIWLSCAVTSTHYFVFAKIVAKSCKLDNDRYLFAWTLSQLILGLLLPSIGIYVSYCILWCKIRQRRLERPGSRISIYSRSSRCMTRTVFVIVLAFTLCQTPYHITQIIHVTKNSIEETIIIFRSSQTMLYLNAVSQILVFFSSCCNPIIYGLLNNNYSEYISHLSGLYMNYTLPLIKWFINQFDIWFYNHMISHVLIHVCSI